MKPKLIAVLLVAFLDPEIGNTEVSSDLAKSGEARMIHFEGALPKLKAKSAELQYDFDLAKETFEIFVPKSAVRAGREVCSHPTVTHLDTAGGR